MRVTPVIAMIEVAAVAFALTACAHWPAPHDDVVQDDVAQDVDGVPCTISQGAPAVFIEIDAAPSAPPPAACEVDRHTRITFRGVDSRTPGFQVRFSGESPAGPYAPMEVTSRESDGRQKASLVADNEPGEYDYAIVVRGAEVDPVIIIRQ